MCMKTLEKLVHTLFYCILASGCHSKSYWCRSWNSGRPLAIFRPICPIWPSKSSLLGQIYCTIPMGKPLIVYCNIPAFKECLTNFKLLCWCAYGVYCHCLFMLTGISSFLRNSLSSIITDVLKHATVLGYSKDIETHPYQLTGMFSVCVCVC